MTASRSEALRILVADDSAVMRGIFRTLFAMHAEQGDESLPNMEICGESGDGLDCLEAVQRLRPDILVLDLEMPKMNGLDVLDRLQIEKPELPVIMCSAYTEAGARTTLDALTRGAWDYVMKPSEHSEFSLALQTLMEQLLPKIAALAMARGSMQQNSTGGPLRRTGDLQPGPPPGVIVIGISTGGPLALERMLPTLPADLPVPVLIVQHMPKLFTGALAERLDRCSALQVKEAFEGADVKAGSVWLAPGDMHMELRLVENEKEGELTAQVSLMREPRVNHYRPSVDSLFQSAAKIYGAATLAVVMTGMGSDGLSGARAVHAAGGTVLVQDEATSVVWGMPGRVAQAGIADATLPLMSLGPELARRVRMTSRRVRGLPWPQTSGDEVTNGLF